MYKITSPIMRRLFYIRQKFVKNKLQKGVKTYFKLCR
nr:MAG TPA: hypothetical protein [Caudoviricetes sp.]DAU76673.1 MAG TPA: hypothetical protein [Caudoviricetes sp.]